MAQENKADTPSEREARARKIFGPQFTYSHIFNILDFWKNM